MAIRQFAIPLDASSFQTGNTTLEKLRDAAAAVEFVLSNTAASPMTNTLNVITKKSGTTQDHVFTLSFSGGKASASLSSSDIASIYSDAESGDWDYVEAKWTLGSTDTPITSVMEMIQSGSPYDYTGWPPKSAS